MFNAATLVLAGLAALAPLGADASLSHGSRRSSRHNARALNRRADNATASTSGSAGKCRSHKPTTAISLSSAVPTASTSATTERAAATTAAQRNAESSKVASSSTQKASASAATSTKKASATSSSSAAASSSTSSSSGSSGSLKAALFPVSDTSSWTTASGLEGAVKLTTDALNIVSEIKSINNPISTHSGRTALQASFPKGNWGLNKGISGGMSWYGQGQTSTQDWNNAKEMTFGYGLFFTEGFDWNKGGKLPGLYFGTSEDNARGCSGGNRDTDCASVRLMWRTDGKAEAYTYLPNPEVSSKFNANKVLCNVAPESDCNDTYGASVGRGAFNFKSGAWNDVAMRVLLNTNGDANGEIEVYLNGESQIKVDGLIISSSDATRAQGIMAQSFFGGSDSSWASPQDQDIYFSDFSVAITKTF
ncbi:polysaccharide lyase family 14 protein [Peniophora sp. CONT]|nr:polysaccharide lyase family 14 protein [Peniophora sp. CONT]